MSFVPRKNLLCNIYGSRRIIRIYICIPFPSYRVFKFINIPVLSALNVSEVLRCKMNLTTRTHEPITHGLHVDGIEGATHTAVFYLNTNNGATVFENGKKYYMIII